MPNEKADLVRDTNVAVQTMKVLAECIACYGPAGVPSGHLYAAVMGTTGITLDTYNALIGTLVRSGLVNRANYVLTASAELSLVYGNKGAKP